jgi:peptidoglycan/LPS O-acetylase OafA/YrhL
MAGRTLAANVVESPRSAPGEQALRAPAAAPRIAELDGIRALAIWMVLLTHAIASGNAVPASAALRGWREALWQVVAHGWLGVDLFFVLSGFLITGILLETKPRANYFSNFYIRRALRILPVFLVLLAILALVDRGPLAYFGLALLFCANLAPLFGIATPLGAGPLWSLAVEEQFYLFWPALVRVVSTNRLVLAALFIVVLEPLLRLAFGNPGTELFTWMRCDGLALGALVAIWVRAPQCRPGVSLRVSLGAVGLALALGGLELLVRSPILSEALRTSEANLVFGAMVLGAYTLRGSRWTGWLRSRPAVFFAGISYCTYVIHLPVFNLVDDLGWTHSSSPFTAGFLRALYGFPIVFAIATLSKRYLEEPFLRLKGVLSRS